MNIMLNMIYTMKHNNHPMWLRESYSTKRQQPPNIQNVGTIETISVAWSGFSSVLLSYLAAGGKNLKQFQNKKKYNCTEWLIRILVMAYCIL